MKLGLRKLWTLKVPNVLFFAVCLLLCGVAWNAVSLATDIAALSDAALKNATVPVMLAPSPT